MRVTYLKGVPQYHAAPFMIVTRHLSMLRVYLVGFFSFKFDYRVGVFFIAVMLVDFQLAKVVNQKNSLVALPLLEHFFFYGAYAPLVRTTSSMHTANEHDYLYRASYGGSCCSNSLIISTAETKRGLKIIPSIYFWPHAARKSSFFESSGHFSKKVRRYSLRNSGFTHSCYGWLINKNTYPNKKKIRPVKICVHLICIKQNKPNRLNRHIS